MLKTEAEAPATTIEVVNQNIVLSPSQVDAVYRWLVQSMTNESCS